MDMNWRKCNTVRRHNDVGNAEIGGITYVTGLLQRTNTGFGENGRNDGAEG